MTTLEMITTEMESYNGQVAYGSECNAWQDYVANCFDILGCAPWDDDAAEREPPEDFATYWLSVSKGEIEDYDAETGGRMPSA